MRPRILCTIDGVAPEALHILRSIGPTTARVPTQRELPKLVENAEILVVQLGLQIDRTVLASAPKLKVIATATTGLDHIDVVAARKRGIRVLSLQGETAFLRSITATAEHALGLLLALVRHVPAAHASVLRGEWDRARFTGHSLAGKTLGIVGYGRLGSLMGKYGKALGMEVVFTDPAKKGSLALGKLLKRADVVSLHVPLTEQTLGMIAREGFRRMKPTAVLLNTSRGKVVDETALLAALKAGKLAGYAADVLADEPSFTTTKARSKLIAYARVHDNVLLTPHIGGTTVEARRATDVFLAEKLSREFR